MRKSLIFLAMAIAATGFRVGAAEPQKEWLYLPAPGNYQVVFETHQPGVYVRESVPPGQSSAQWTEKVTEQVFSGGHGVTLDHLEASLRKSWIAACGKGDYPPSVSMKENSYVSRSWAMTCAVNPTTGKPAVTYFKLIQGDEGLYAIEKAFTFMPERAQAVRWIQYLHAVTLCNAKSLGIKACAGGPSAVR